MRSAVAASLLLAGVSLVSPVHAQSGSGVAVEGGAVWQTRNNVQIPNADEGTRFSLRDLQGSGGEAFFRVDATWQIAERHHLRALYAPYSLTRTGIPAAAIEFDGTTFAAGLPIQGHYRFDSYRLTYRYRFHEGGAWTWWGGATIKVRDADIRLRQGALAENYSNTGLVPLLSVVGERRLDDRWSVVLDVDGLWAPQGRAIDAAAKLRYSVSDRLSAGIGYRTLEGGADNDDVYTFAWQHYALAELRWRF